MASSSLVQTPTRVRYGVLAFIVVMAVILYLDRNCISMSTEAIHSGNAVSRRRLLPVFPVPKTCLNLGPAEVNIMTLREIWAWRVRP